MMRACVIVLDSCGVGELPDAAEYGDSGSNTIANTARAVGGLKMPNMQKHGLGNIIEIPGVAKTTKPSLSHGKMASKSAGKDSTTGHWEHFGIITQKAFPVYPNGFPDEIIKRFISRTGKEILGNKTASGTEIIKELGLEHLRTGKLIVYTSADSVFQIAAHRKIVPIPKLYEYCQTAREILVGEHAVSRVIARPFDGEPGDFYRTDERHDFSLTPTESTGLDLLKAAGYDVIGIGKISDLFAGRGITQSIGTNSNTDGMDKLIQVLKMDFRGLAYINLVDFDMLWGHRNDYINFARGLEEFDSRLNEITARLKAGDLFLITADHGCDPTTPSTDHSREYVPILAGIYPFRNRPGAPLGNRSTFSDLGATVLDHFGLKLPQGTSFLKEVK